MSWLARIGLGALSGLKAIPWYVFALVLAALVIFAQHRTLQARDKTIDAWKVAAKSWATDHQVQAASIATLKDEVAQCSASVAGFKAQADAAAARAAQADKAAQAAALDRTKAVALLRAAPPPVHQCPAPPAHNAIRGLL